jgi:hypothetical protein
MPVAWIVGKGTGKRLLTRGNLKPSKFDDVSTALLGLLLAFSFGVSFAKYDQRRLAVVADSNAIGDFYTCASLLKEPFRTRLQGALRQYVKLRLEVSNGPLQDSYVQRALARFDRLHDEMTQTVYQALSDGTPIAVPLTNTLNGVTSSQASRLAAYRDRLPGVVVFLLFTCSIIAAFLIGREEGAETNSHISGIAGMLCFTTLVTTAVFVTLDLNSPATGLIHAAQEPMDRLLAVMLR